MRLKKVTSDVFDHVKKQLKVASVIDVAKSVGLSVTTVRNIDNCEDYEDYLDWLSSHYDKNFNNKIRDMGLGQLKGEPLFWKIHSDGRNLPVKLLAIHSGLSSDTIKTMKKAEDYEAFLRMEGKEKYMSRERYLTTALPKQIQKMLLDDYTEAEICQILDVTQKDIERAKEPLKVGDKLKIPINSVVWQTIKIAIDKGLTYKQIVREIPISTATFQRIKRQQSFPPNRLLTKAQYYEYKAGKRHSTNSALVRTIKKSNSFEEFSLKWYCNLKSMPTWLEDGELIPKVEKVEEKPEEKPEEKRDKYALYRNEFVFKMFHRGAKNGASAEEMAESAGVPVSLVKELLSSVTWKTYIKDHKDVVAFVPEADKTIFNDVMQVKNGIMTHEAIMKRWGDAKLISEMSRYDNFPDYLIGKFFKGVEPLWLDREPEPKAESVESIEKTEVEEPEKKPVEQKLNEEMANMAVEQEVRKIEAPSENKVKIECEKEDVTDLLMIVTKLLTEKNKSEEMKYKLLRFKYLGIFILAGIAILGLLGLGYLLITKG